MRWARSDFRAQTLPAECAAHNVDARMSGQGLSAKNRPCPIFTQTLPNGLRRFNPPFMLRHNSACKGPFFGPVRAISANFACTGPSIGPIQALVKTQTVVNQGTVVRRRNSAFSEREREEMGVPEGMTASV